MILTILLITIVVVSILLSDKDNVSKQLKKNRKQHEKFKYENLLRTNEWHSKRKEILEKRGCKCEWCGSHTQLQLHHKYYLKYPDGEKINPWDYPDDAFVVLCNTCHEKAHKKYKIKTYYTKRK